MNLLEVDVVKVKYEGGKSRRGIIVKDNHISLFFEYDGTLGGVGIIQYLYSLIGYNRTPQYNELRDALHFCKTHNSEVAINGKHYRVSEVFPD